MVFSWGAAAAEEGPVVTQAVGIQVSGTAPSPYVGGRGVVTFEGPTGLFINPTSGTLPQGQFAAQYCILTFDQRDALSVWHQGLASYGVTDWLEVGAIGVVQQFEDDATRAAGGPFARLRLLKDEAWQPEVSLGAILREGDEQLTRRSTFAALSKRFPLGHEGAGGFRLHAGARYYLQGSGAESDAVVGYLGGEIELPRHIFLVVEVSTRPPALQSTPYAFGFQLRRPDGFGFTLAAVQTGNQERIGVYVGIGINFFP
jgi:hypothetical protein